MIPLEILSKSYKIAYEYRYKSGTSFESTYTLEFEELELQLEFFAPVVWCTTSYISNLPNNFVQSLQTEVNVFKVQNCK